MSPCCEPSVQRIVITGDAFLPLERGLTDRLGNDDLHGVCALGATLFNVESRVQSDAGCRHKVIRLAQSLSLTSRAVLRMVSTSANNIALPDILQAPAYSPPADTT